jgi:hypothetical protein
VTDPLAELARRWDRRAPPRPLERGVHRGARARSSAPLGARLRAIGSICRASCDCPTSTGTTSNAGQRSGT